jgi:hypothetical protein
MKTPQRISCHYSVSLHEVERFKNFHKSEITDKIYRQISGILTHDFITERDDTHTRVYEFNGYVVSANDLERMIEEGIQKRQMRYPRSY